MVTATRDQRVTRVILQPLESIRVNLAGGKSLVISVADIDRNVGAVGLQITAEGGGWCFREPLRHDLDLGAPDLEDK